MEIAVISGKGGTGKSSISAALMALIPNVMAVDCDVDASNLYLLFNPVHEHEKIFISGKTAVVDSEKCTGCRKCADSCKFDAISIKNEKAVVNPINCEGCALCTHLCPHDAITMAAIDKSRIYAGTFRFGHIVYGRLAPGEENSGKMVNELRLLSHQIAIKKSCPVTIIDGPPGIGCAVMSTITGADKVIIVAEPSISGFSDLKRTVELVHNYAIPCYAIINKCTLNEDLSADILHWCDQERIPVIAQIPFDVSMVKAMIAGQTIVEYAPESEIVKKLKKALVSIY